MENKRQNFKNKRESSKKGYIIFEKRFFGLNLRNWPKLHTGLGNNFENISSKVFPGAVSQIDSSFFTQLVKSKKALAWSSKILARDHSFGQFLFKEAVLLKISFPSDHRFLEYGTAHFSVEVRDLRCGDGFIECNSGPKSHQAWL